MADQPNLDGAAAADVPQIAPEDAETVDAVKELVDSRILPAVMQSGGSIAFHSLAEGIVYLQLSGAAYSMLPAIENMLRHYVPEVTAVRDYIDTLPKPGLETDIGQAVAKVLNEKINPAVAGHGGHISLIDVQDDSKVILRLEGGCQGCGMASVTLRQGVEVEIKQAVPQITDVIDVTDHAGGDNPYYQSGGGAPIS